MKRFLLLVLSLLMTVAGCATTGAAPRRTTPTAVVDMEEMHISAHRTEGGELSFESYDAETLFRQATDLLNRGRCMEGVGMYDRIASEFSTSRYFSSALYNAGLCLLDQQHLPEADQHFAELVTRAPDSPDVKDALFQRAGILIKLEHWSDALGVSDQVLARTDLSPDERMEGFARRAEALFGATRLDDAEREGRDALSYYRTRPEDAPVRDTFFAAAANFVVAEVLRTKSQAIAIPQAAVDEQRRVLNDRAALLLQAQTEYFNTMRFTDANWSAAAGYRIGSMYDDFWQAIMTSPPPPRPDLSQPNQAIFLEEYRRSLRDLVRPLLQHAVRYWELTLMMVERTGVRTDWEARARVDLERVRARLVEQTPGGSPASSNAPTATEPSAALGTPPATSPASPPADRAAPRGTPSGASAPSDVQGSAPQAPTAGGEATAPQGAVPAIR